MTVAVGFGGLMLEMVLSIFRALVFDVILVPAIHVMSAFLQYLCHLRYLTQMTETLQAGREEHWNVPQLW